MSRSEKFKEGLWVLDPVRLYEHGPERLSNKHTQSLNGSYLKKKKKERKGKEKHQSVCHVFPLCVYLFHFSFSHCNVCPSIATECSRFLDIDKCPRLNIRQRRNATQIPLGVYLYFTYWAVNKWCSSPREKKRFLKSDEVGVQNEKRR